MFAFLAAEIHPATRYSTLIFLRRTATSRIFEIRRDEVLLGTSDSARLTVDSALLILVVFSHRATGTQVRGVTHCTMRLSAMHLLKLWLIWTLKFL